MFKGGYLKQKKDPNYTPPKLADLTRFLGERKTIALRLAEFNPITADELYVKCSSKKMAEALLAKLIFGN